MKTQQTNQSKKYHSNPEYKARVKERARERYDRVKDDPEFIKWNRATSAKWKKDNRERYNEYIRNYLRKRRAAKKASMEAKESFSGV